MLVDAGTADDAAVYRLDAGRALVATVDFFTPIVDDPYDFGRIAAANALSDVYAMGARPLFALNLVAFPRRLLGEGLLEEIVRGGGEAARLAGVPILGGHSIDDEEPKFGLAVIGEAVPDAIVRNSTARPGDRLVLTKPLGTGIVSTALKAGAAAASSVEAAVASMATLNRAAAEAMLRAGAHAATDVTGFGLVGHLREMLRASGVAGRLSAGAVPLLPDALELARAGHIPGGSRRNLEEAADVDWRPDVPEDVRALLTDAQTSGGLLVALPAEQAGDLVAALRAQGGTGVVIGAVLEGEAGRLEVTP